MEKKPAIPPNCTNCTRHAAASQNWQSQCTSFHNRPRISIFFSKMRNSRIGRLSLGLCACLAFVYALPDYSPSSNLLLERAANFTPSLDVSGCSGYTLRSVKQTNTGLTASLDLAGPACNAFGQDIANLTIQVTYETSSRLHVSIFDTANKQYTIPESVVERPPAPSKSFKKSSDLVFNYESSPFAFWITRRSQPHAAPLFDTRIASFPKTPIPAVIPTDNSTTLDGFPLVFEDQYLQIASVLPLNTNIYGLGEVVASSGFRRDVDATIQTMWARDIADPVDQNIYGSHPIYLEHRFDTATNSAQTHGVFLLSAAGGDILLLTPPNSNTSLIEYRMIGGVLDFYFLSGPTPKSVIEQYGALVGLPTWQPAWGFGFHLCRWGYKDVAETRDQVTSMRAANIPLEVMWNDIDLYHAVRDFTSDPVSFPASEMKAFIEELKSNNQHYIPIVDAAIAKQINVTDIYDPYTKGVEQDVFITNLDGTEYIGQVWPGYTVFPDWFQKNTQSWWTEAFRNWSASGIEFSGIWLDMNEASSFCDGSCGTGADLSNTSVPFLLPGEPGNPVLDYPECYNSTIFGPSGNITVNGTLTCNLETVAASTISRRGLGAGKQQDVDLNTPPYAIHNGNGRLSIHALATNASHADGQVELDVHNIWGLMEEKATHLAVQDVIPNKRPFLISRSTFPSSGRWTGHWLGDNFSLWAYLRYSIAGVLQFQIFQIPFVGADTCGFNGNSDEELCNRWMQLSAFTPFYRNHNIKAALSQEPYRWESVANASRTAIAVRYSLLPYWYTLFANASMAGTPPVRALFFEFPNESELFNISSQFLVGGDILVTPVLDPNVTSVSGIFPGRGSVVWRDWYSHDVVNATAGALTTLAAPLGHINVHIRDGSAILLHAEPAYTIEETRQGPYSLLVSQTTQGLAHGTAYVDDGISSPPGPSRTLTFAATKNQVSITGAGGFHIASKLQDVTVLGVGVKPATVLLNGKRVGNWTYAAQQHELVAHTLSADLNQPLTLQWK
ncbi:glycoside hydrolase family 31 protein [Hypholoma sublateritium FD-334 SS-4]|uniref:Glycoside hydrolase family 31 protein n=1 Tax=Hypholoma sublateritium (strain FD-334 SS-4) TaxID=945553 RepID=A0A0D2PBI2_HYPSF|nr:glycoside hydrolase family 31 protein [Hypholoma sublateritium FD-334 SS-4]